MICKHCKKELIRCEASDLCVYKKYKHKDTMKHLCDFFFYCAGEIE